MAGDAQALLLQVSADTSEAIKRLDDLQNKISGVARNAEKRFDAANQNIASRFGKGIGASLGNEIQGLAGQASRASTELSGFGAAGTAAAAAIAAIGVAFVGAREAARFSNEIAGTANRLHVTTDALQEYRYAIRAAGGEEKGADDALEAFSVTLGKAQQGLAKSQKAFLALGFSKEQIKGFTDADTALRAVVERIAGLSDVQQDAIIQQLGLEGIKPLIDDGVEAMERLRAEAHKVGVVMDADLIKRGAELNDQFETVQKVIDIQLKSALVDLGSTLVWLLKLVAELASVARDVADAFRSIQNKSIQGLKDAREERLRQAESPLARAIPALRTRVLAEAAQLDKEIKRREATAAVAPPVKPSRQLIDASAKGGGKGTKAQSRDNTLDRTAQVDAALADVERDLLSAWSRLIVGAEQHAEIQNQLLDIETQTRDALLDKQIADIKADEGLSAAKKDELTAKLEIVRSEQKKVDALKREDIARELAERQARELAEGKDAEIENQVFVLQAQAALARTAAERRDIELRLLDLADQQEKLAQEEIIASQTATQAQKDIAAARLRVLEATRPDREEAVRQGTQGPMEEWLDSLPKSSQELNEAFQRLEVQGINSLIDAAAAAASGAKDAGDIVRQAFQQMAMDATRILLQNALANAGGNGGTMSLISSLFGGGGGAGGIDFSGIEFAPFASGGAVRGPGTGTSDSVPAMLSNGEFVVNAEATRRNAALLAAINNGRVRHMKDGGFLGNLFGGLFGGMMGGSGLPMGLLGSAFGIKSEAGGLSGLLGGGSALPLGLLPKLLMDKSDAAPAGMLGALAGLDLKSLIGGAAPAAAGQSLNWYGDVNVTGSGASTADNRRTARQIAAGTMESFAMAKKFGLA